MVIARRPLKIWYQSFIDPGIHKPYFDRLESYLSELADPGVEYTVRGISPPDRELHRLTEFRCAAQTIKNALRAQEEGYDAFAIGHFQDSGLYEVRSAVRIPVLGMGEASMLHASTLGSKFGLVTIHPVFIPIHEECVARYGLRDRCAGTRAFQFQVASLVDAFTDPNAPSEMFSRFREESRPLVVAGADVLIPAGGLMALLFSRLEKPEVEGAVVLNGIAVLAKMTEMAVKLYRLTGTAASRTPAFANPSAKAVREFLDSFA